MDIHAVIEKFPLFSKQTRSVLASPQVLTYFLSMDNEFFMSFNKGSLSLALTSANEAEGKTLIALLFGLFSAVLNPHKKILLIDASRDQALSGEFGTTTDQPLVGCDLTEHICSTAITNLFVLPLMSKKADLQKLPQQELLALKSTLNEEYFRVFVDTGAQDLSKDHVAVSRIVENVLIVIRHRYSTYEQINALVSELERVECNILGATLNQRVYPIPKFFYGK